MEVLGEGGVTEEPRATFGWSCGKGDGLQHCGEIIANHNTETAKLEALQAQNQTERLNCIYRYYLNSTNTDLEN